MRLIILFALLLFLIACGGGEKINTGIHIPDVDTAQYSDSNYLQGWKYLKAGDPSQAIKYFQKSHSVEEKVATGFGYAYLALNKLSLAQQKFTEALTVNPQFLQAQLGMAALYEQLPDMDQAFQIYARLLPLHPGHAWIKVRYQSIKASRTQHYLEEAGLAEKTNDRAKMITALEKAAHYSPEIIDITIKIADFHFAEKNFEKAAIHYEKVLETSPNRDDILIRLAQSLEQDKKYDSAVIIYKRLLELKPGEIEFINKINDLKMKFYELDLPEKFRNIFFKQQVNREELAALIGYYFKKYLAERPPVIITDIDSSFAREEIIKICALKIMDVRPDHSFDRYPLINRAAYAVVLNALVRYLEDEARLTIKFTPMEEVLEPSDISPLHKNYRTISFLVNSQLIKMEEENKFNPTAVVTPGEVLLSIRKILNSIENN